MRYLRGRKGLITGAASGLGKAIALRLAREGVDVCLVDIDDAGLKEVVAEAQGFGVETIGIACDVTNRGDVSKCVETVVARWGHLEILVNNAGVAFYGPTANMTAEQWDWLLAVNLHAPIQFTRELLPVLLSRDEAHIVNIASIAGLVAGGRFCGYHVTKFGLVGFSEALRAEYGRQGLGVSAICPGPVRTNLYRSAPSGHRHKETPTPPAWICTTAERVAEKTIRAIRRDRRLVLVSPLAHGLFHAKRWVPGLLDAVQRFGRRKRLKQKTVAPPALHANQQPGQPHESTDQDTKAA